MTNNFQGTWSSWKWSSSWKFHIARDIIGQLSTKSILLRSSYMIFGSHTKKPDISFFHKKAGNPTSRFSDTDHFYRHRCTMNACRSGGRALHRPRPLQSIPSKAWPLQRRVVTIFFTAKRSLDIRYSIIYSSIKIFLRNPLEKFLLKSKFFSKSFQFLE